MKQKTLLLFQLCLAVFAFYALLKYPGNSRYLVSLACLVGMFVVAKVETSLMQDKDDEKGQRNDMRQTHEMETALRPLDCLLKSNNVLLLTDAIQYLIHDLGLSATVPRDQSGIDRLVSIPGMEVTFGLKILSDVADLNGNLDKWEELAQFDLGRGMERRLLIITGNSKTEAGDSEQESGDFSVYTQKLLAARHLVAMTTLTLRRIYLLCKKKNIAPKKLFRLIQQHPGGVFQLEQYAKHRNQSA